MKVIILLTISMLSYHVSLCQEYKIVYTGIPELYEYVDVSVKQEVAEQNFKKTNKYSLKTTDGSLKGNRLFFDRRHIHEKQGTVVFDVKHNGQSNKIVLSLPILETIKFNLYADSIKPVLNYYLNVEGIFSNGKTYPLDTNFITITSDKGHINGTEWVKPQKIDFESVSFVAICKYDNAITTSTKVYLKKALSD